MQLRVGLWIIDKKGREGKISDNSFVKIRYEIEPNVYTVKERGRVKERGK